jgi:hypothetical protein
VASPSALRAAVVARLEAGGDPSAESAVANACAALGPTAAGLATITASGTATLADRGPAAILVGPTPAGGGVVVALSPSDCSVLETIPVDG